ncbi:MAG: 50S ribosome-binding GTPase [Acidimicrobiaceae bacterium]|nr:50S ribosome-binding GTPase [Acidimicrobiaceae bacterium]
MAIVGRPNVGKSTLFNRLVGEDRSVVHDMAGTTRDSIDTVVETPDGPIVFVDTAGMRRRSRIDDSAEYYSMVRALRAIDDADIALLVIDATVGITSAGSATRRARRRLRLPDRGDAQQVGADRRRREAPGDRRRGDPQAVLHRRFADPEDLGAHRQGCAQAAPRAAGRDRAVPPPGAHPRRQPGDR